ncbi:hypothetical protein [Streptomyces sp. NPDC054887]
MLSSQIDDELGERLAAHHEDLLAFYGRTAVRRWEVAKHFSF